jgi:hypothetical protein
LKTLVKCDWVWNPTESATSTSDVLTLGQYFLCAFDAAAQQVFVRRQTGGSAKLRSEMHPGRPGRRGKVGEADRLVQVGLNVFYDPTEPPAR